MVVRERLFAFLAMYLIAHGDYGHACRSISAETCDVASKPPSTAVGVNFTALANRPADTAVANDRRSRCVCATDVASVDHSSVDHTSVEHTALSRPGFNPAHHWQQGHAPIAVLVALDNGIQTCAQAGVLDALAGGVATTVATTVRHRKDLEQVSAPAAGAAWLPSVLCAA